MLADGWEISRAASISRNAWGEKSARAKMCRGVNALLLSPSARLLVGRRRVCVLEVEKDPMPMMWFGQLALHQSFERADEARA